MDFQAIITVARTLFEGAVDVKLIDVVPEALEKINLFSEVEKLRAAEKTVAYKKTHPNSRVDPTIQRRIRRENIPIEPTEALWPGIKVPLSIGRG